MGGCIGATTTRPQHTCREIVFNLTVSGQTAWFRMLCVAPCLVFVFATSEQKVFFWVFVAPTQTAQARWSTILRPAESSDMSHIQGLGNGVCLIFGKFDPRCLGCWLWAFPRSDTVCSRLENVHPTTFAKDRVDHGPDKSLLKKRNCC